MWRIIIIFLLLKKIWNDPQKQSGKADDPRNPAYIGKPFWPTPPADLEDWPTYEKEHRRQERQYWRKLVRWSMFATGAAFAAAIAAVSALDASWTSIQTSQDTESRQLRAYVGITFGWPDTDKTPNSVVAFNVDNGVATAKYVIKNYGLTPANDVKHKTVIDFAPSNKSIIITDADIDEVKSETIVFPQQTILSQAFSGHMTRERIARSANPDGSERLYVIGVVRYKDVFNVVHHLHFCSVWGGIAMNAFPNCPDGNDSD